MKFSSSTCQILGWAVLVRVDSLTYSFLGDETLVVNGTVNLTSVVVTPTQTMVVAQAGSMQVNLTFLNPIEVRSHSLLLSMTYIRTIQSLEIGSSNPSHFRTWLSPPNRWTVQIIMCKYIQTSAEGRGIFLRQPSFLSNFVLEWNSGDRNQEILWSAKSTADVIYHSVTLQTQAVFTEIIDQAEWGTLYYAMQTVSDANLSDFLTHSL